MLSLVIYQGLSSIELERISLDDIDLRQGKISVKSGAKTNARTIDLEAHQLLDLQNYMLKIRPELLLHTNKISDRLFVSKGNKNKLSNAISNILKHLRKLEPKLKNFQHIRSSVITIWVKKHGLRKAQYMAGHRFVSSTEIYKTDFLEDLKNQLDIYHPL